jgi:hypothetical protein
MSNHTSLAVAYRLNGVNFRMSAEKLTEGLDTLHADHSLKR